LVSLLAGSIGLLVGYAVVKKRGTVGANTLDRLSFFPYLLPSMAFGAIYLSMFAVRRGFIPSLYGTFAILVLIGTVKYLLVITDFGELDFYQAQAIVGVRMVAHNILILQAIFA
jgi:ABC-type Fe3+ transport system permease subunit